MTSGGAAYCCSPDKICKSRWFAQDTLCSPQGCFGVIDIKTLACEHWAIAFPSSATVLMVEWQRLSGNTGGEFRR